MFQSFVGLEIHIQLQTVSKIFCSCRAAFGDEPNTNVCPVCMGYPGTLPALNAEAVRMGYLVARSLNCTLARTAVFDRKNYYYPDLPKNYQISQYGAPVGTGGYMDLEFHRKKKRVRIHDVHVEEDPAKMIHAGDMTLLDFNRSGTPLLEIVTEPDLEIGEEAEAFLQNFRRLVRYLGVCDGNMEEGSLRCDANVSVNLRGKGLGDKVEVKNMNSSRFVRKAIAYEIQRQEEILSRGGTVQLETRLWNENRDITESMRTKETAQDYRYFPDPDLPPFRPGEEFIAAIEDSLIELPYHRRLRLITEYGLNETQADFICDERETADFFEATVAAGAEPLSVAAWLGSDVRKLLNRDAVSLRDCPLTPERLAELLGLLAEGKIHGKIAKQVLDAVFAEDKDPCAIIAERGLEQITDRAELAAVVERVLESHAHVVRSVREGDGRPVGFLVGQIMKATAGRAEPLIVNELLKERLASDRIVVLAMGGAISGSSEDGMIVPGNADALRALVDGETAKGIAFEDVSSGAMLSEEITPEDWASLIAAVAAALEGGNASGIVIPHGTDTLSYTASLIYWLFRGTGIPIVFTASITADADDARNNLTAAIRKARSAAPGVYVILGDGVYSPVNLRFERIADGGFRNWNLDGPVHRGTSLLSEDMPRNVPELRELLEGAIRKVFIARVFPGMQAESLIAVMNAGARYLLLELYDSGTANLRESPFSLREAFRFAREEGIRCFCTSQQEGIVDFSGYVTSHELWKDGAIPMGSLTTESAYTRLLAAIMTAGNEEEVTQMMEEADADIGC